MAGGVPPTGRAARMLPTREGSGNLCPSSEPSHSSRSQLEPDRFLSFVCSFFFKTLLSTRLVPYLVPGTGTTVMSKTESPLSSHRKP